MTSRYYTLDDEHRIERIGEYPTNSNQPHIEIQNNFGNCSQIGVYLYVLGSFSPSAYNNVYYTDTFDEAHDVMEYVLSGLREEDPVPEEERILQEIEDGERDIVSDADEINHPQNGYIDFVHYGEDEDAKVVYRSVPWQKYTQGKGEETLRIV